MMPAHHGLAAVTRGVRPAPPKGPTGNKPGRSGLYKRARWLWGQTRKVLRRQGQLLPLPRASSATS